MNKFSFKAFNYEKWRILVVSGQWLVVSRRGRRSIREVRGQW